MIWRLPARDEPVADLVAGGGVDRAVPFQDAKWAQVWKRVMSPTSSQQPRGTRGPDPGLGQQRGAGLLEQRLQPLFAAFLL